MLTLILSEVWTVNDLIERVGPIERPVALKALLAWVDRGVLREENDENDEAGMQRFRLLESAPTDGSVPVGMTTAGSRVALAEEQPAVLTVQQQQAEQMKVYWKVCSFWSCIWRCVLSVRLATVHRGHAHESGRTPTGPHSDDAQVCAGLRPHTRPAGRIYGRGASRGSCQRQGRHLAPQSVTR